MKTCRLCHIDKPESCFWKRKSTRDGLDSRCTECANPIARRNSREYRAANPDKMKEYNARRPKRHLTEEKLALYRDRKRARYHQRLEESRAKAREKSRKRRKYAREFMRKLRAANPERYRAYNKQWRAANKESVQASDARKRVKRRAAIGATIGRVTAAEWKEIKERQKNRCWYCNRKTAKLTQDHVVPLASGGEHTASNIVAACGPCNSSKHKKPIEEFARLRGRLFF